jgi:membrane fusion protein, multidrug efflux system
MKTSLRCMASWRGFAAAGALAAASTWVLAAGDAAPADPAPVGSPLATVAVSGSTQPGTASFDGVVEALRQTTLAAQVPGSVVALQVKAGDRVQAGQLLLRIDARAAEQAAAASSAQVRAARAQQEAATREFERQKQLFEKSYISQAALDRAEAQYKATQAEAAAQLASAGAARTQSDHYVVRAPYAGVVADVRVVLGDMAMPGRPLLTVYDPGALRVSAAIPQTVAARLPAGVRAEAEIPGLAQPRVQPARTQLLPAVDPATHTVEMRLDLPAGTAAAPGMFARAWLPVVSAGEQRLYVPAAAVLRRAEMTAVYVVSPQGRPLLRQVRLGRTEGDRVEVLSGVSAGERVALEPHAAARVR